MAVTMPAGSSAASAARGSKQADSSRQDQLPTANHSIPQIGCAGLWTAMRSWIMVMLATVGENIMANEKGPNIKKKQKCKNCEGKGLLKKGDRVVKCQRCKGTGVR
jgi:hypothetical protein